MKKALLVGCALLVSCSVYPAEGWGEVPSPEINISYQEPGDTFEYDPKTYKGDPDVRTTDYKDIQKANDQYNPGGILQLGANIQLAGFPIDTKQVELELTYYDYYEKRNVTKSAPMDLKNGIWYLYVGDILPVKGYQGSGHLVPGIIRITNRKNAKSEMHFTFST